MTIDARCGDGWEVVARAEITKHTSDGPGVVEWDWNAGLRAPGEFRARIEPFQIVVPFRFSLDTAPSLELCVPPPTDCAVRIVGAEFGETPAVDSVTWWADPSLATAGATVKFGPDGTARLRVPRGRFTCVARRSGGWHASATFDAGAGDERFELVLERGCTLDVVVRFVEAFESGPNAPATKLPAEHTQAPLDWSLSVTPLDGTGRVLESARTADGLSLWVDEPGTYEIAWITTERWRGVAARRVELVTGGSATVELLLEARD